MMSFDLVVRAGKEGKVIVTCLAVPHCEAEGTTLREAVDLLIEKIVSTVSANLRGALEEAFKNLPEKIPEDKLNGEFSALFTNFPVSLN